MTDSAPEVITQFLNRKVVRHKAQRTARGQSRAVSCSRGRELEASASPHPLEGGGTGREVFAKMLGWFFDTSVVDLISGGFLVRCATVDQESLLLRLLREEDAIAVVFRLFVIFDLEDVD